MFDHIRRMFESIDGMFENIDRMFDHTRFLRFYTDFLAVIRLRSLHEGSFGVAVWFTLMPSTEQRLQIVQ
jgi:hypothetical protein